MTAITYDTLPRKERLRLWMRLSGLTYGIIADAIGVKENTVSKWLRADIIPVNRRKRLERYGIPVELLPIGMDRRPGPKRLFQGPVLALPPAPADAEPDSTAAAN